VSCKFSVFKIKEKSMAKKIFAVVLGFVLAPAFITAQNAAGTSIVGSTCLVRVYHTNFRFPPEGGRIVQIGDEMFFWKTYLPECLGMLPDNTPVMLTSATGVPRNPNNLNGAFGNQFAGEPCAVRVYHTNFRFPSQGGRIVQIGNEMFFIRTYKPGCESAGAGGTVLAESTGSNNPLNINAINTTATGTTYVDPSLNGNRTYTTEQTRNALQMQNTNTQSCLQL
jgi:hypothetical protein